MSRQIAECILPALADQVLRESNEHEEMTSSMENSRMQIRKRQSQEEEKNTVEKGQLEADEPKRGKLYGCCNNRREFYRYGTDNHTCDSENQCQISPGDEMMTNKKTRYCMDCWEDEENTVTQNLDRDSFWKMEHWNQDFEATVECSKCYVEYHAVCENYLDDVVDEEEFVCRKCGGAQLPTTLDSMERSEWDLEMEKECNKILAGLKDGNPENEISVVSFKTVKNVGFEKVVPRRLVEEYKKEWNMETKSKLTFEVRSIYIFQRIDGVDTPFLALYTQEYPTRKLCVLDYLDTVPFTTPNKLRPICTEALILGYYRFMASKGFQRCHLWAKAPVKFDSYAFVNHPVDQRYLDQVDLETWYMDIFTKGESRGVVERFWDFEEEYEAEEEIDPIKLPVYSGSQWSLELEDADQYLKGRFPEGIEKQEVYKQLVMSTLVMNRLKFVDSHFTAELKNPETDLEKIKKRSEEDFLFKNGYLDNREVFMRECRKRKWEFSTLRRAKHSAIGIINVFMGLD